MAYIPQFIPTNTQVLQGTLDQYQKAYDVNTSVFNQTNDAYSAIPTSNAVDTKDKNAVMNNFSSVIDELDKKYNYDRASSQYTKELASKITELRSHPLWGFIQQKDELNKMRTQLIAQKGSDYYENFDPTTISLFDPTTSGLTGREKLQGWKPQDLNMVRASAASKAKEYATSWKGRTVDRSSVPGTIQYLDRWGASNEVEAANYLSQHPEELDKSIPEGFDKKDPRVRNIAANAWISNAIGEVRPSSDADTAWIKENYGNNKPTEPIMVGTRPITNLFGNVKSLDSLSDLNSRISSFNKIIATSQNADEVSQAQAQLDDANYIKDKISDIYDNVANTPSYAKILEAGKKKIDNNLKSLGLSYDRDYIFRRLEDYYLSTNAIERGTVGKEDSSGREILDFVKKGIATNPFKEPTPSGYVESKKSKRQFIKELSDEILSSSNPTGSTNITNLKHALNNSLNKTLEDFNDYWKGTNNNSLSYKDFKKEVDKQIADGEILNETIVDIKPSDTGDARYMKSILAGNLKYFSLSNDQVNNEYRIGKSNEIDPNKINDFVSAFLKEGETIHGGFSRESDPSIILESAPTKSSTGEVIPGKQMILKSNFSKMSPDVMGRLYQLTGRKEFLDARYKDIKFSNKKEGYTLNDSDNYLQHILSANFDNLKPFSNIKINRISENGRIKYVLYDPEFGGADHKKEFGSKSSLFEALAEIYMDRSKS